MIAVFISKRSKFEYLSPYPAVPLRQGQQEIARCRGCLPFYVTRYSVHSDSPQYNSRLKFVSNVPAITFAVRCRY